MAESVVLFGPRDGNNINSENYAAYAESIMKKREQDFTELTTTKLRSIYSLIMNLYTKIGDAGDFEEHKNDIQYLKVKMAYEAGRDEKSKHVRPFFEKTYLMKMLSNINDYQSFVAYCRYAESLVAYFKFYGGK